MSDDSNLLFVFTLNGEIRCLSSENARRFSHAMLDIGFSHTATINPARWIEALANDDDMTPQERIEDLRKL